MPAPMERGAHLVDQDEWERRRDAEKQARINRFAQGAMAIERTMDAPAQGPSFYQPTSLYQEPVPRPAVDMDALDAQFTALNQRFSE